MSRYLNSTDDDKYDGWEVRWFMAGARWAITEVWRQANNRPFDVRRSTFANVEEICKIEEDK